MPAPRRPQPEEDRSECRPCGGSGHIISGLGGTPHDLPCPWCGGSGAFIPERDAQETPAEQTSSQ